MYARRDGGTEGGVEEGVEEPRAAPGTGLLVPGSAILHSLPQTDDMCGRCGSPLNGNELCPVCGSLVSWEVRKPTLTEPTLNDKFGNLPSFSNTFDYIGVDDEMEVHTYLLPKGTKIYHGSGNKITNFNDFMYILLFKISFIY